ncbi:MAG: hypothetical protein RBS99_13205 [Rhodospirillales bacterium]|nr:hypothetical protein [Rhodospirillales bacterium]
MTAMRTASNFAWDGIERRTGQDRRSGADRRSGIDRRSGLGFRPDPDRRVGTANDNAARCPWGNPDRRVDDRRKGAATK